MDYYRRKRGTVLGRNYRFAEILDETIPLDDELQRTRRTMKKKSKASKKRLSTAAADGIEGQQPAAKRAADASADAAAVRVQFLRLPSYARKAQAEAN